MSQAPNRKKFIYSEHTGEYVEIQGLRVHVTAGGDGDPLLLIHGIGQSSYTWRRNFDLLCEQFFVVAVDMIGYGYSDRPSLTYTIEENSEFLLALLNVLRIRKTHIVAMGSGATYAMDFMIHYPERVERAVCIAPGGVTEHMPMSLRLMATGAGRAVSSVFGERTVRRLLHACLFDQTCLNPKDVSEVYKTLDSREAKEVLSRSIHNFDESEVISRLRMMPHETLFLWGLEDRWRPLEEFSEVYLTATPNALLATMRNCGHLPHEEKPERFCSIVQDFLLTGAVSPEV